MEPIFKPIEFLSYFICMGAGVFRLVAIKNPPLNLPTINNRLIKVFCTSLLVLMLSTIVLFLLRVQSMSGTNFFEIINYIMPVLQDTHYGRIFILRFALLVLLVILLSIAKKTQDVNKLGIIMFLLIVGLGYTFSAVSHAADNGSFSIPEIIDWMHLLSTSIWGGSILITLLIFYRNIPPEFLNQRINIAILVNRLSTICAYALLFVLITGFYKLQGVLTNGMPLWSTNYGKLLGIKLIFVAMLVSLGIMNRYISMPRIARWAGQSSNAVHYPILFFSYALITQAFILLIILTITSMLVNLSPSL